jgi:hypothetical protein
MSLGTCVLYGPHLFFSDNLVWFGKNASSYWILVYYLQTRGNPNILIVQGIQECVVYRSGSLYSSPLQTSTYIKD